MSACPRLLLTYSLGGMVGGRQQGLKVWSAMSIHMHSAGMLWGGLPHQCVYSTHCMEQSASHWHCFSLPFGKGKLFWFTACKSQGDVVLALLRNSMSSSVCALACVMMKGAAAWPKRKALQCNG